MSSEMPQMGLIFQAQIRQFTMQIGNHQSDVLYMYVKVRIECTLLWEGKLLATVSVASHEFFSGSRQCTFIWHLCNMKSPSPFAKAGNVYQFMS